MMLVQIQHIAMSALMKPFCSWEPYADSLRALKSLQDVQDDQDDHPTILKLFLDSRTAWLKNLVGSLATDRQEVILPESRSALADAIRTLQATVFDTVAIFVHSETDTTTFRMEPLAVGASLSTWVLNSVEMICATVQSILSQVRYIECKNI